MSKKFAEYNLLDLPAINREVLERWEAEDVFRKSLEIRKGVPSFIFYEGPPSANGMPGIHHVIARSIKDIFCRYKTMKGFLVNRKAGWDTHGLPVELGVEKSLGITKEDIGKKISVEEYNAACRKDVMKYTKEWEDLTRQMGYWVDMEHPYITFDNKYIETLWYLLKQLYDKGLLYKGYTIQPYSPAAGTGLSSHELNQPGCYRDVKDLTCVAMFKLKSPLNPPQGDLSAAQETLETIKVALRQSPPKGDLGGCKPYNTANPASYEFLKENAKNRRKNPTEAENFLWENLKGKNLDGYKFRREHVIGDFIVDFVCLSEQLVIEVDGGYHNEENQQEFDKMRSEYLNSKGFKVIRFTNEQVLFDIEKTFETIKIALKAPLNPPSGGKQSPPEGDLGGCYFLAWTTTPWTLPSNTALCVGANIDYVRIKTQNPYSKEEVYLILAEVLVPSVLGKNEYEILEKYKGKDLEGLEYEQLIPFAKPLNTNIAVENKETASDIWKQIMNEIKRISPDIYKTINKPAEISQIRELESVLDCTLPQSSPKTDTHGLQASVSEIFEKIEKELEIIFPKMYIKFFLNGNLKEGNFGENYISFWRYQDIMELNKDYQIWKYLPKKIIAFATDGGDNCFAFDYRNSLIPKIVKIPLGDLDINEIKNVTDTFEQFIFKPETAETQSNAFRVICGDFVTTEDGTGIVHIAPTFGADDDRVAKQNGIAPMLLLDKNGKRVPMVDLTGKFYTIEDLDADFVKTNVNVELYRNFSGKFVKDAYIPEEKPVEKTETAENSLSEKVKEYLIEKGWYNTTENADYQQVIKDLGIDENTPFADFNLHTTEITFNGQKNELYNVCWFSIYSDDLKYGIECTKNVLKLPEEYIPLDSFEAEGGFFYNKKTGEVLELELGQKLNDFHNGKLLPQWKNFNAFLEWYFEIPVETRLIASLPNTENHLSLDTEICLWLQEKGLLFKKEKHTHNYPHCWRTDKPVLYYPLDSWFIRTTAVKDEMIALNNTINWKPQSTGTGRFGKWLENLNDWNLSRSRYWGTPLPIWRTEDGSEEICIGSLEELFAEIEKSVKAGFMQENPYPHFRVGDYSAENYDVKNLDLHRPYVDNIVLVSQSGKPMKRELDLIDVWFDSGAMPFAQGHWPFEDSSKEVD